MEATADTERERKRTRDTAREKRTGKLIRLVKAFTKDVPRLSFPQSVPLQSSKVKWNKLVTDSPLSLFLSVCCFVFRFTLKLLLTQGTLQMACISKADSPGSRGLLTVDELEINTTDETPVCARARD